MRDSITAVFIWNQRVPGAEADVPAVAAAAAAPNKLGAPEAADPPEGSREGMSGACALPPPEPDPEAPPSPPVAAAPFCPWLLSEDDMLKSSLSLLKRRPEDLPPDVAAVSVESRLVPGCGPASPNSSVE